VKTKLRMNFYMLSCQPGLLMKVILSECHSYFQFEYIYYSTESHTKSTVDFVYRGAQKVSRC